MPSAKKLQAVAAVLDLEFYFGPPRGEKNWQTPPHLPASEPAGEAAPGLEPVRDRQLAELLAIIADHYERENDYGRQVFIEQLKAHHPALFRRGVPLGRAVAWLGWKVLPGAARKTAKRANPATPA